MILRSVGYQGFLVMIFFAATTAYSVFAGDEKKEAEAIKAETPKVEAPVSELATFADRSGVVLVPGERACLVDAAALEDLQKRREDLETKQKDLLAKDVELKSREAALNEEIKKLQKMREQIAALDQARKGENDAKVKKVVETLETMSPKAASLLLASLDDMLAVSTMAQISTARLAKIMNVMQSERASRLTELLAGVVRARTISSIAGKSTVSRDAAETALTSTKGGEKNDGQSQQQYSRSGDRKPGSAQQKGSDSK